MEPEEEIQEIPSRRFSYSQYLIGSRFFGGYGPFLRDAEEGDILGGRFVYGSYEKVDRLIGRLQYDDPDEVMEEFSTMVAEGLRRLPILGTREGQGLAGVIDLDEMERRVAKRRRERIDMNDALRIESSDREVNVFFERLKIFKSDIVHQVARKLELSELLDCTNYLLTSYEDNRLNAPLRLRYYKREIRRTLRLIELTLKERDTERFTKNLAGYLKIKEFKEYFLKLIERWNDRGQEKRMESSDERSKPESKGMVFKRNTLRKQHNSQRDDPGELFPDLLELETVLEDCVFHLPQLVSFIIIHGLLDLEDLTINDTNMDEKMLMISNQGCGEAHKLSIVVGNTTIIAV